MEAAKEFSDEMGIRLTFIDMKGNVLADSVEGPDYIGMENHLGREEITEAILSGKRFRQPEEQNSGCGFSLRCGYPCLSGRQGDDHPRRS